MAGSIYGLAVADVYEGLTPAFQPQAVAEDVANLAVVVPIWIISGVLG